jgi:ribosomal protein S18 acetylase RimI-like enzyme
MHRITLSLRFASFRREDAARLVEWLEATPVEGLCVPPGGDRWIDRLIQDPNVEAFMAFADEGLSLGFARVDFHPDRTADLTLIVDPLHRRRGVGCALLAETMDRCRRRGHPILTAICPKSNPAGKRFFEAFGFRPAKTRIEGFDRLELWIHEGDGKESPLLIEP